MSTSISERTLRMKKEYMSLRAHGMGPREIAKHFGLSYSTVSRRLTEIAEENGVAREELLAEPWKAHEGAGRKSYGPVPKIDTEEFSQHVRAAGETIHRLNGEMERLIEARTKILKKFEEEKALWQ